MASKEYHKEHARLWRQRNPERYVASYRRENLKKYKITVEEYEKRLKEQNGGCAICGTAPTKERRLCVDHDHETGVIRGLLCYSCNIALGHFQDSRSLLQRAVDYLWGNHEN
jgi:hypothetical protein